MLPAPHRMTNGADFASVVRRGRRAKTGTLIVHQSPASENGSDARVGFVVSKAVGGSVVRKRVTRRLRAQVAPHLAELPGGSGTVVRALPAAATASSAQLGADLDRALTRLAGGNVR